MTGKERVGGEANSKRNTYSFKQSGTLLKKGSGAAKQGTTGGQGWKEKEKRAEGRGRGRKGVFGGALYPELATTKKKLITSSNLLCREEG